MQWPSSSNRTSSPRKVVVGRPRAPARGAPLDEQDELLPVEGQLDGLGLPARQGDHEQVQAPGLERRQEGTCHGLGDLGHELGKACPEGLEDRRQQVWGDGRYDPEPEWPVVDLSRAPGVRDQVIERRESVMGQGQELLAERREDHASRGALEELGSEARLERGDGGGHGRLGDREVVRGGAEVPLVGDSSECAELDDGRIMP